MYAPTHVRHTNVGLIHDMALGEQILKWYHAIPIDTPQWRDIEEQHLDFENDPHNLHLGVGIEGVNPYA